jgi:hypothetical protein
MLAAGRLLLAVAAGTQNIAVGHAVVSPGTHRNLVVRMEIRRRSKALTAWLLA